MVLDINAIQTQVKSILDTANDTAASYDLSSNLTNRVKKVFAIDITDTPVQNTLYPFIAITTERGEAELTTIAKTQASGGRKVELKVHISAAIWMSQITDVAKDNAREEIYDLIANIEEVLRNNDTLNSTVKWHTPEAFEFQSAGIAGEQAHLRIGIFTFNAIVFY